jgi:hypothetical protein
MSRSVWDEKRRSGLPFFVMTKSEVGLTTHPMGVPRLIVDRYDARALVRGPERAAVAVSNPPGVNN